MKFVTAMIVFAGIFAYLLILYMLLYAWGYLTIHFVRGHYIMNNNDYKWLKAFKTLCYAAGYIVASIVILTTTAYVLYVLTSLFAGVHI